MEAEIAAAIKAEHQRIGKLGGLARAKALSASERQKIALKASKAAARARSAKAKEKWMQS